MERASRRRAAYSAAGERSGKVAERGAQPVWTKARNSSVVARARFHYLLYNVDETRSLGTADFGLLLDYEFRD